MTAVLVDTTVLIDILRGRPRTVERLWRLRARGDRPVACAINVEEIERGLRGERETEVARRLFDGVEIVDLDRRAGVRAGAWRRAFAARGVTLSQADCLIAAAAFAVGGRLVTGNPTDFPMPEISVEHWPSGE